jgi:hypothetical protein
MTNIKWKANFTANKKRAEKRIMFGSAKLYPAGPTLQARGNFPRKKSIPFKTKRSTNETPCRSINPDSFNNARVLVITITNIVVVTPIVADQQNCSIHTLLVGMR